MTGGRPRAPGARSAAQSTPAPRQVLARRAEAHVAALYEADGWTIVARNARLGRLELDIVAERAGAIAICEVRARSAGALVHPAETVDRAKIARVRRAAAAFLATRSAHARSIRLDVASVIAHADGRLDVEMYENAM